MFRHLLLAATAGLLGGGSVAQAVLIDDFSDGSFEHVGGAGDTSEEFGLTGVIAPGERDATTAFAGGDPNARSNMNNHLGGGIAGSWVLTTDTVNTSGSWQLAYGVDIIGTPNTALDVDLTDGGLSDHFAITFSQVPTPITFTLSASDGVIDGDAGLINVTGPGTVFVPFSGGFSLVDMTNIVNIRLGVQLNAPGGIGNGFSVVLDRFETTAIPEPAGITVAALGALLLARRRRAA